MNVGEVIEQERLAAGLSYARLAWKAGMSKSYLIGVVKGEQSPTVRMLEKIAKGLGKDLHIYFNGLDHWNAT